MRKIKLSNMQTARPAPSAGQFLRSFALTCAVLLGFCALLVFLLDPFFHYHRPWFGLAAVQTEKEYQVVGALDHLSYDSLIVGSSVTENNYNGWYDEAFGGQTIKAVRSYGATADLCWLLSRAHETHRLRNVYYNIDPTSLYAEPEVTFAASGCPMYLYDRNPFNDISYLLNKTVLFEEIPHSVLMSLRGYDENTSYNWWTSKTFSREAALSHYTRSETLLPEQSEHAKDEELRGNLALLTAEVAAHPETDYYFFFPPYSALWWDNAVRTGARDFVLYDESRAMKTLLQYKNVRLYCFQADTEIIFDLDNYMDALHFRPEINHQMVIWMKEGRYELHSDADVDAQINALRRVTDRAARSEY